MQSAPLEMQINLSFSSSLPSRYSLNAAKAIRIRYIFLIVLTVKQKLRSLHFFNENIGFPTEAEYSCFSAEFRLNFSFSNAFGFWVLKQFWRKCAVIQVWYDACNPLGEMVSASNMRTDSAVFAAFWLVLLLRERKNSIQFSLLLRERKNSIQFS